MRFFARCAICAFLLPVALAPATTVAPIPVATVADHAAVVCEALVESVTPRWSDDSREIVSDVRFTQVSYWKGSPPPSGAAASMNLEVPGGTIGSKTMRIAGAPEFNAGERWVLFVLAEYRTFPVVGLWEGAFRVEADTQGIKRVHDANRRPVEGIDESGFIRTTAAVAMDAHHDCAHAEHVRLATPSGAASDAAAMRLDDFKGMLTPILTASRAHPAGAGVGRRVPTHFTPVPLVRVPGSGPIEPVAASRARIMAPEATTAPPGVSESSRSVRPKK